MTTEAYDPEPTEEEIIDQQRLHIESLEADRGRAEQQAQTYERALEVLQRRMNNIAHELQATNEELAR